MATLFLIGENIALRIIYNLARGQVNLFMMWEAKNPISPEDAHYG
jgi:hypothetical protein